MKHLIAIAICAGAIGWLVPAPGEAGVIERACRGSDRQQASPRLCTCIQGVANQSLSRAERKTVAKWFRDPHKAQVVRQSDRRRDEILWQRYKAFGERAAQTCG